MVGAEDGVCHTRDLSLGLAGVLKGCRSGESAGRVWGSLLCRQVSALEGAVTVELESGARLEQTLRFGRAALTICQSLGVRPGGYYGFGDYCAGEERSSESRVWLGWPIAEHGLLATK